MALQVIFGFGLFLGSMAVGYWLGRRGVLTEIRASQLVRWIVMGPTPVVLCLAFWGMNLSSREPWLLPLLGLLISISSLLPAFLHARFNRLTSAQTGSFLNCALFSNVGYFGAFTAFALYGEKGYALCMLYLVFFTPCFYTLGFALASHYGKAPLASDLAMAFKAELRLYPFAGMVMGLLLNFGRIQRPEFFNDVNHALIPLDTALYLIAIGSQLTFRSPRPWLKACIAMCVIKFVYSPAIAWFLLNLTQIEGLTRTIVLLEAMTPVAVSPLVLPLLFGLDRDLANALWLFTTVTGIFWFLLAIPVLSHL